MLQTAIPLRKSAPWPLNISDEHVSFTPPDSENASFQIFCKCPTPAIVFGNASFAHFDKVHNPLLLPCETTSERPKVLRAWCVLYILAWNPASHHSGAQFFISYLASWLRTRRFSEPTFLSRKPLETQCFATLLPCRAQASSFFSLFLFSDLFSFALSSLTLPTSSFPSVHIVGRLGSKLPSVRIRKLFTYQMLMHTVYMCHYVYSIYTYSFCAKLPASLLTAFDCTNVFTRHSGQETLDV